MSASIHRSQRFSRCLLLSMLVLLVPACATVKGPKRRVAVTRAELQPLLTVGQPWRTVLESVGEPRESFDLEFGSEAGEPWDAWVAVYWGKRDPFYQEIAYPLKHRLVFAFAEGDTLLDHWVLAAEPVVVP